MISRRWLILIYHVSGKGYFVPSAIPGLRNEEEKGCEGIEGKKAGGTDTSPVAGFRVAGTGVEGVESFGGDWRRLVAASIG